tara:strand:- start:981 stop:1301 length:321 start_codon:yes stop_codon:yes gene_type:complete
METNIYDIANIVSGIGILSGLSLKTPKVYRALTTEPTLVSELSTDKILIKLASNTCFLFYMIINKQIMIIIYCSIIILFEGTLLYMKHNYGEMKKSSSETNLLELI